MTLVELMIVLTIIITVISVAVPLYQKAITRSKEAVLKQNLFTLRTLIDEYRRQSRGGKGLINIKTTGRNGRVVGVKFIRGDEGVMLITKNGMIIRLNTADISTIGRNTQGVRLIQLEDGDQLVSVARLAEREDGEEPGAPPVNGDGGPNA